MLLLAPMTSENKVRLERATENPMSEANLERVLKEHSKNWMSIPGVVGAALGVCDDRACIIVFVVKRSPALDQKILGVLPGVPIKIEETGELRSLPLDRR